MISKIKNYIEDAFENAPNTKGVRELKEEMTANLIEKYNDLIAMGKTKEESYREVVKGIGNIDKLISDLKVNVNPSISSEDIKKSAKIKAIATALYILSPVLLISLSEIGEGILALSAMLILIAIATGLLVYDNATKPQTVFEDEDILDEFMQWRANKKKSSVIYKSIKSVVWLIILCVYFLISFTTNAWHVSWVVFLIGAAINLIIDAFEKLRGGSYE